MSILKLTFEALEGQKLELQHIKSDVKDLRENAPLFAVECDEISNAVKRHGVALLGGKQSNAYQHAGLEVRSTVISITSYTVNLVWRVIKPSNVVI